MNMSPARAKRVLVITDRFGETGGSRTEKFVKYLPKYGYEPFVLTKVGQGCVIEPSVNGAMPRLICVWHVPSPFRLFNKIGLRGAARFFHRYLFVPDISITWLPFAFVAGLWAVKRLNIEVIYSTSPYESNHLVAMLLNHLTARTWVADFRDLWSHKHIKGANESPTRVHQQIVRFLEGKIMKRADLIVANTQANRTIYQESFGVNKHKIMVIPNGYDPDDFREIGSSAALNSEFTIGYSGYFGDPFPWKVFMEVVEHCPFRDALRIEICGYVGDEVLQYLKVSPIGERVKLHGIVSHIESLRVASRSDVLLLLLYETDFSRAIVPMKTYNYFMLRRPIMAIADPLGSTGQLLRDTGTGVAVSASDRCEIEKNFNKLYSSWCRDGHLEVTPCLSAIKAFSRDLLTGELVSAFDATLQNQRLNESRRVEA